MSLFIGIDGGGTKTTCVVGNESSVLATASAAGSNVVRLGEAEAKVGLQAAVAQACRDANISPLRVQAACVGAAGATNPDVNTSVRQMLRQILPNAEVVVLGDMVIAMEAALHHRSGVVAIAGTGSIAYGSNKQGETARAGGWGYAISDEGSGQWIGRTAVSEAMRAFDAARDSVLLERILGAWNSSSRDDLIRFANASPPPNFADLFPVVQQAAVDRDVIASDILTRAGAELAELVLVVLHRLWKPAEMVRVGVVGGVFANSQQVRRSFYNSLRSAWPRTSVCFQIVDPVIGALGLARQIGVQAGAGNG
jgi:N-acetylglucosamine kinase-like BadF-type ATPase